MEQFACQKCLKVLVWEASQAGQPHVCPSCESLIAVPEKPGIPRARAVETHQTSLFGRWQGYEEPLPYDPGPPIALVDASPTSKQQAWRTVSLGLGWCFGGTIAGWGLILIALALQAALQETDTRWQLLVGGVAIYTLVYGIGSYTTTWAPEGWIRFLAGIALVGFVSTLATPFCCFLFSGFDGLEATIGLCAAFVVWLVGFDLFLWSVVIHFRDRDLWNEPKYLVLYQTVVLGVAGCVASGWPTVETQMQAVVILVMQLIAVIWQMRLVLKVRSLIERQVG